MRFYTSILLWAGLVLFLMGCQADNEVKTIKLAHGLDVNHSVHKALVKMGEDLEEISKGKMTVEIYPNQQLGTERQIVELLQIGSLDMTKVSAATLENFAPKTRVLGLPYLFRSREHSFRVFDGPIGEELLNDGKKYWLKGLGFYDAGSRSFYTKEKAIESPGDLKGQKIRVMPSVTAMEMVRGFGGSPTPISWGELYTSLQQGVVDGAENNPPSFYLSKHYEICKYYSLNEHTFSPDIILVATHFWDKLSEQEQNWLQQAVDASVVYQRELWAKAEAEALDAVQKAGVEISRPDKSLFSKETERVYEKYKADETLSKLIQQIKAVE